MPSLIINVNFIYSITNQCIKNVFPYFIEYANKYYDTKQPWVLYKQEDKTEFNNVMATCAFIIANLSNLFSPFMPFSAEKIRKYLKIDTPVVWETIDFKGGQNFGKFEPLFTRISEKDIE